MGKRKTERGMLFHQWSMERILKDIKKQTRRIIVPQPTFKPLDDETDDDYEALMMDDGTFGFFLKRDHGMGVSDWNKECPYGFANYYYQGDSLYTRETHQFFERDDGTDCIRYKIDGKEYPIPNTEEAGNYVVDKLDTGKWRPSLFQPKWAARMLLPLVETRIERVQDITEEDAKSEGADSRDDYRKIWDKLNKERKFGWDMNPWLWVLGWE